MEPPPQRNSLPPWRAQDTGSPDPCSRTRALCPTAPPAGRKRRPDGRPAWRTPGRAPHRAGASVEVRGCGRPPAARPGARHSRRISGASASLHTQTCPSPACTRRPRAPWPYPWGAAVGEGLVGRPQQGGPGTTPDPGGGASPELVLAEVVDVEGLPPLGQDLLLHLPGCLLLAPLLVCLGGHGRGRVEPVRGRGGALSPVRRSPWPGSCCSWRPWRTEPSFSSGRPQPASWRPPPPAAPSPPAGTPPTPNQDLSAAVEDLLGPGTFWKVLVPVGSTLSRGFRGAGETWLMAWVPRPVSRGLSERGRSGSRGS